MMIMMMMMVVMPLMTVNTTNLLCLLCFLSFFSLLFHLPVSLRALFNAGSIHHIDHVGMRS